LDGDELVGVYREAVPKCLDVDHFELVKVIGREGFSKVLQVRKKYTGRLYAIKTSSFKSRSRIKLQLNVV
jgi:serine/threonine protein kinase